jgi:hypothetical protein
MMFLRSYLLRAARGAKQLVCSAVLLWASTLCAASAATAATDAIARPPQLSPDYSGIVIPPNIAPLNFVIEETNLTRYAVRVVPTAGSPIEIAGKGKSVSIPMHRWKSLLQANMGKPLYLDVRVQRTNGTWTSFARVTNTVSSDPMDPYLVYRLLRPVYNLYGPIGIYQRTLASFEERPLLENRNLEQGCLNCHTFLAHNPDTMALHIRNKEVGNPMLLIRSNEVTRVDKTSGYISWHPTGRLLAFSVNKFALLFHTTGETRDLYDAASDLGILRIDSNVVVTPPPIAKPDRLETWPSWAPDGKHLYFCSAPNLKIERLKQIRYDLMRVSYDIDHDRWGEPETIVSARDTRLSAAQPRISPDGRWLLFCLAPNGNFPAYQAGSDLYMVDLSAGAKGPDTSGQPRWPMRRLDEINSDLSDSWHCWSSNGRWMVFSSKRRDGLFTRPYLSHFENGHFSKPVLLPQEDPEFYDSFVRTYNLPEFVQKPVPVSSAELTRAVFKPKQTLKPTVITPQVAPAEHEADEGRSEELAPRN